MTCSFSNFFLIHLLIIDINSLFGDYCITQLLKGYGFGVELFANILPMRPPTSVWLESRTNTPLTCQTKWICQHTGKYLMEHQIKTHIQFGGKNIPISKTEMKQIKDFGLNGINLLGFKPRASLKLHHNIRAPYFLYPDERTIKGSIVAFNALRIKMMDMNKIAIVAFSVAKRDPRLAALLPQEEDYDSDKPPGFNVIILPFLGEIRSSLPTKMYEQKDIYSGDTSIADKAKNMIERLGII